MPLHTTPLPQGNPDRAAPPVPVGSAVAPWSRLAWTIATATAWGIRGEQVVRRMMGSRGDAPPAEPPSRTTGTGKPLVLLNGLGVSGLVWPEPWVRELQEGYRVIRVDNRGTGRSRNMAVPFTISDLADDVAAVLDAEGVTRATVLGFSMGGIIAQELAVRHPGRVERLILVSTVPPTPVHVPTTDYRGLRGPIRHLRDGVSLAALMAGFYLGTTSRTFHPTDEVVEELTRQLRTLPTSISGVIAQSRAIVAWRRPERLATLTVPTTVVAGADDPVVRPVNGRLLAALIPDARYTELSQVGHMVPWEAGQTLIQILRG